MDSNNILEILNRDCLIEVLQQNCIGLIDLVEIAATCTQLRSAAAQVFRKKYKNEDCDCLTLLWSMEQRERLFQYFGSYCEKLTTFGYSERLKRSVLTYCDNLKELWYSGGTCSESHRQFFSKLIKVGCVVGRFEGLTLFRSDSPIQEIVLRFCDAELPQQLLPSLQHVKLWITKISAANFVGFCQQNPQLLSLELNNTKLTCCSTAVVIDQLKNLQELSYIHSSNPFPSFLNLTKLRKIRLFVPLHITRDLLNALHMANAPLESLELHNFFASNIEASIDLIRQFKGIRKLTVSGACMNGHILLRIIRSLPQLEHIHCGLYEREEATICDVLQSSNKLKTVSFKMNKFDYTSYLSYKDDISAMAKKRGIKVCVDQLHSCDRV